jgi:predicted transcriptional regulator
MATAKDELRKILDTQPEDSSTEELVRELAFHVMVQRGLADADAGRVISNEEMKHRIQSWAQ